MKVSEILVNTTWVPVVRSRNLQTVGWWNGYLCAKFRGRPTVYIYGPNVPQAELQKIARNPFPDRIFTSNVKNKFQHHKVEIAA